MTDHATHPSAVVASPAPPASHRKKPIPHKCSTCGDRECRKQKLAVCWTHCVYWKPETLPLDKFLEERGETYGC